MPVRLVIDSSCDLPPAEMKELADMGISMVPLLVHFGMETIPDQDHIHVRVPGQGRPGLADHGRSLRGSLCRSLSPIYRSGRAGSVYHHHGPTQQYSSSRPPWQASSSHQARSQ